MDEVRALRGAPDSEHFSLEHAATIWTYGHSPLWFREAEELTRIDGRRLESDGRSAGPGDTLEQAQAVLGPTVPLGLAINWDRQGIRSFQLREMQLRERLPRPLDDTVDGLRSDQYYRREPGPYLLPAVESVRVQEAGLGLPVLVADGLRIGRLTAESELQARALSLPADIRVEGRFDADFVIEALQ